MKYTAIVVALCALCALVLADDAPEVLFPCSFRLTTRVVVTSVDGEELATSMNETIRDNGDYWVWKSQFSGNQFISTIVPDHEWSIVWRPDKGMSYRHDINAHTCYNSTNLPTPYNWIQSKTFGIVWFDELVNYNGEPATVYTAVSAGTYGRYDFEATASLYVINKNKTIVFMNGTVTAQHREIDVIFRSTSLSFEHNKAIDPKFFAVSAPCPIINPPSEPGDTFKKKCYNTSSAAVTTISWFALVMALLVALMNF